MQNHFGLDIGVNSIKIVSLKGEGKKRQLLALGEVSTPAGGLEATSGEVKVIEGIKKLVKDLEIKSKLAVVALPETKAISRVLSFPPMKESEIYKAIFYEAETFIPYPLDQVQIDYQIIENTSQRILVFVAAAPKKLIERQIRVVREAGLMALALETTAIALARTFGNSTNKPMMVLDIGAKTSTMVVTKNNLVFFTRTIVFGGEAFTRSIGISLGMDTVKAEEYKKAYGLESGKWEDKIKKALTDISGRLVEEIKRGILTFKEEWGENIGFLVVSGGGALLPGLTDELVRILGIEVQIGQPLAGIEMEGARVITDNQKEFSKFATATGLAKRER